MERSAYAIPTPAPLTCPSCGGPVDVKSRHVAIAGSAIRIYCSAACQLQAGAQPVAASEPSPESPAHSRWPHVVGMTVGLGLLVLGRGASNDDQAMPRVAAAAVVAPPPPVVPVVQPAPPAPAVVDEEAAARQLQEVWVADLQKDVWFHPLAGPERRMPHNHSQAFGAERAGDRPIECFSGHCGVDVGGGLWGERVRAVHDGVVDRVNRGPNEERGGIYVRIAHRDGTVFTQYFHLAAVPKWITAGTRVSAGQVIGLLGDTGVKHSAPHLHFAISVKPTKDSPERYLDPEPLIAIWPLWIPDDARSGLARISTHEPPGLPARGGHSGHKSRKRHAAVAEPDPVSEDAPPEAAPPEPDPAPAP